MLGMSTVAQAGLNYNCNELSAMAVRFHNLKTKGYELEEVLSVVQQASVDNPEKEALLSNMAIEIYIDPLVETVDQARAMAWDRCGQ